jgi:DNA gyrase/topoisomerase IV subunit B
MAALHYLAPEFIAEGRLHWLRSPLYIVKKGQQEQYYFTESEFSKAPKDGIVQRAKGLGALSPEQAKRSMFGENQRMDKLIPSAEALALLEDLMGAAVEPRAKVYF